MIISDRETKRASPLAAAQLVLGAPREPTATARGTAPRRRGRAGQRHTAPLLGARRRRRAEPRHGGTGPPRPNGNAAPVAAGSRTTIFGVSTSPFMVLPRPKKGASCFHPPGTARWIFREPAGLRAAAAWARFRPHPGGDLAGSLHAVGPELAAGGSGFGQRLLRPGPTSRPGAFRTLNPGDLRLRAPGRSSLRVPVRFLS